MGWCLSLSVPFPLLVGGAFCACTATTAHARQHRMHKHASSSSRRRPITPGGGPAQHARAANRRREGSRPAAKRAVRVRVNVLVAHRAVPGSDLEFFLVERLHVDVVPEHIAQRVDDGLGRGRRGGQGGEGQHAVWLLACVVDRHGGGNGTHEACRACAGCTAASTTPEQRHPAPGTRHRVRRPQERRWRRFKAQSGPRGRVGADGGGSPSSCGPPFRTPLPARPLKIIATLLVSEHSVACSSDGRALA